MGGVDHGDALRVEIARVICDLDWIGQDLYVVRCGHPGLYGVKFKIIAGFQGYFCGPCAHRVGFRRRGQPVGVIDLHRAVRRRPSGRHDIVPGGAAEDVHLHGRGGKAGGADGLHDLIVSLGHPQGHIDAIASAALGCHQEKDHALGLVGGHGDRIAVKGIRCGLAIEGHAARHQFAVVGQLRDQRLPLGVVPPVNLILGPDGHHLTGHGLPLVGHDRGPLRHGIAQSALVQLRHGQLPQIGHRAVPDLHSGQQVIRPLGQPQLRQLGQTGHAAEQGGLLHHRDLIAARGQAVRGEQNAPHRVGAQPRAVRVKEEHARAPGPHQIGLHITVLQHGDRRAADGGIGVGHLHRLLFGHAPGGVPHRDL